MSMGGAWELYITFHSISQSLYELPSQYRFPVTETTGNLTGCRGIHSLRTMLNKLDQVVTVHCRTDVLSFHRAFFFVFCDTW